MTSAVAAIVALGAGSVVTAFLYFKRSAEFPWDLALLRFIWTALLVYAIVAPPISRSIQSDSRPVLTIVLDSSRSLGVNADSLVSVAYSKFEALGYEPIIRDYKPQTIPVNGSWAYVGDAHIDNTSAENSPDYFFLAPSVPLQSKPLLQGISVPQRVLQGSQMEVVVLAAEDAEIQIHFDGKTYEGPRTTIKAPQRSGYFELRGFASLNGKKDTLKTVIKVEEYVATLAIVTNAPHPHEALVRRWSEANGIEVQTFNWRELEKLTSVKGPIITIGGGETALGKIYSAVNVPLLHLDGGVVKAFPNLKRIPVLFPQELINVYAKVESPRVVMNDQIDARGIHWYKSALASKGALKAFNSLLEELMQRYEPAQLRLTLPQRIAVGEEAHVIAAVVNSRQEVLPADFEMIIKKGDTLVEELTLYDEANSKIGRFKPSLAGNYSVEAIATWSSIQLATKTVLQANAIDMELVRERNEAMIATWSNRGAVNANEVMEKVEPVQISFEQKNPQHLHIWYWGLALLAAAMEWIIRRRRGLV